MTLGRDQAKTNTALEGGMSKLTIGTCVALDWINFLASVSVGGGVVPMPMAGAAPQIGDQVWVGFLGNQPVCLGPVPRPTLGTVASAPANGRVRVRGDDQRVYTLTYSADITPVVQTRVAIDWSIPGGFILGQLSAEPQIVPPTVSVAPVPQLSEATFNPVASGTYRNGKWDTNEVWSTTDGLGAFFYGGQIDSTIPDDATILSVDLYVDAISTSGGQPSIGTHTLQTKPLSAPIISNAVFVAGGTGWKSLPATFGDLLKSGSASGLGTSHGGAHKWTEAGSKNSGALTIKWRA